MKKSLPLISIIIFGLIIRLIFINQLPTSLNWDEVSHGFNAYSILKTGHDEWGSFLPLIFRCYGDFKLPLYIYLTTIPILFFGLNPLSVRFTSIFSGTFSILLIFLILKQLFPKNKFIPFVGSLIFCFSPITIFLSRIALEANLFLLIFLISFYFLLSQKYGLSSLFYGLSLFTYNSSRVLLPIYLISLIFLIIKNKINLPKSAPKFIPFIIFSLLAIWQTLNQSGQARYEWVSLLDSGSINKINELRQTYPRILINKITYFTYQAGKNYISHFNPKFLFLNGGSHYQFNIPGFYLISPLLSPFLILGLIYLIKNIHQDHLKLILFWFLASPIPSSITRDAPHVLRSIIFIPFTIIIISFGFIWFIKKFPKISFIYLILTLLVTQIIFWPKYFSYANQYASSWQYGYSQLTSYLKSIYSNYDQIIITKKYGEPHEFILFYWPWNPSAYQNDQSKNWNYHANWYWIDAFDKFQFVNDWEIKNITQNLPQDKKILLVTSPDNYNQENATLITTISFPNQTPAFQILNLK